MKISVVLLAAGKGRRMGSEIPKQFLTLHSKPVVLHSLTVFLSHPEVFETIVVCDPEYRSFFSQFPVKFAVGGERRQDSLYNGLQACSLESSWVCVHDAARPFISHQMLDALFSAGKKIGAATIGVPLKSTIKETSDEGSVVKTLDRKRIWEIQTPQFLSREVLQRGFAYARAHNVTVTDDVSLAECVGKPVKVVLGSYSNIKITTLEDLIFAELLCTNIKFS